MIENYLKNENVEEISAADSSQQQIPADSSQQQRTEVKVTVIEAEEEETEKDFVCLCCPCLPPALGALPLICLLLPFSVVNLVKLGLASTSPDPSARTYFVISSIVWLFILPPWLTSLVSRQKIFHPWQSSILNTINRTIKWLDTQCCIRNIDVYSCTEILWFVLHLFHILLAVCSASRVTQSFWSIPGFSFAILYDLIVSGSELLHGAWAGWQRCNGEAEEFALQGFSLAPAQSIRIKDKYKSVKGRPL